MPDVEVIADAGETETDIINKIDIAVITNIEFFFVMIVSRNFKCQFDLRGLVHSVNVLNRRYPRHKKTVFVFFYPHVIRYNCKDMSIYTQL